MSFTANIPASGQTLGNSRLQVLNNFASLRTTISNVTQPNHTDVNNSGAGKHIFVEMPVQTPGAANLPLANEGGLITQTVSGSSELFYVRDAVNTYFQMTGSVVKANIGTSVVLGGIRIQWMAVNAASGATINFTVPFGGPPYVILGSEVDGIGIADFVKPQTLTATATSFVLILSRIDLNPQTIPRNLNFIAIGPV